jgi:Trk K+ transport system NAD-binding subunit
MASIRRRAGYYLLSIAILIAVSSVVYDVGMRVFEPDPYPPEGVDVSLFHSTQVVVETFTATGYGSDAPWKSPEMNVLIMLLDLTGVGLFFLALPAILLPLFQEALSSSAPTAVDRSLSDHVVICTYSSRAAVLIEELDPRDVPYLLVEPDEERAVALDEEGYAVIHGDPESVSDLERTDLTAARALVADVTDQVEASIVLAAREIDESVRIISVIEEPEHVAYHQLAGADEVLTPRQLLGNRLAAKLTAGVSSELGTALSLGEDIDIMEVPIRRDSRLDGLTLAESRIRERFGVNVIGIWSRGELTTAPHPEQPLASGTILIVTGSTAQLDRLDREVRLPVRRFRRNEAVVVGYGEVGKTVTSALDDADLPYTVIDQVDEEGVDVVGDATETDTLVQAGVPDARAVVLAVPDETATEFATLVVRDVNETAEIIARADKSDAIAKTYRAGADYVLSLATVSGRSVASAVLEDEGLLSLGTTVAVIETGVGSLAGQRIVDADIRERTGCTVVAVERDDDLMTEFDPDFQFNKDDTLVVAGTDEGTNRFVKQFGE